MRQRCNKQTLLKLDIRCVRALYFIFKLYWPSVTYVRLFAFAGDQVSKKALHLLAQVEQEPLLNLEQLNPELLTHAESMSQAHHLRKRLRLLADYLLTCRSGACKKLQDKCVQVPFTFHRILPRRILNVCFEPLR